MKHSGILSAPRLAAVACAALLGGALLAAQAPQGGALPLEPFKERGASITPAYEGWFTNADGSFSLLLGYYNRNSRQPFDIPVGPNNKIEPGPVDQGQPTHFETGRQWGVWSREGAEGLRQEDRHLDHYGQRREAVDSVRAEQALQVAPFKEIGMKNEPPKLSFTEGGPKFAGPPMATAATLTRQR